MINPDLCRDAVIVLPGIMGSELVDASTRRVLWGLADPRWYVSAWSTGDSLRALTVTEDERRGRAVRIEATRPLRTPAFAPFLRGFEPYTELLKAVRQVVPDSAALREFPYDWRLAVDHNAEALAKVADQHLQAWRRHPQGSQEARLVIVAHSMGGLVARYFTEVLGGGRDVRTTVTLGTPFHGSVKAAVMLSTGRGAPLPMPQQRLRLLARSMPGLYDLLPTYRCVDEGTTARRLNPGDIASFGGDAELAQQAFTRRKSVLGGTTEALLTLVGVQQPTMQSLSIADGVAQPLFHTCLDAPDGSLQRVDRRGDSTVYRDAATLTGVSPGHLPQSHSDLAKSEEAIAHVRAVLTADELGFPLGEGSVGLELPDVVEAGVCFDVIARDVVDPAAGVTCSVKEVVQYSGGYFDRIHFATPNQGDASLMGHITLPRAGLYRVQVKRGGGSAVSQLVLAVEPGRNEPALDHES